MFYPQWILVIYNFSGVFIFTKNSEGKIKLSKTIKFFLIIKVTIMIVVNVLIAINSEYSFTLFNREFLSNILIPFAVNVILFSAYGFHFSAILLIFIQLIKSKNILIFCETISKNKLWKTFNQLHRTKNYFNLFLALMSFIITGVRVLVQLKIYSVLSLITCFILIQSHLMFFIMLNFMINFQNFIVFGFEEVEKNLKIKMNTKESLKSLECLDEFVVKFKKCFGSQLTILTLSYTLTIIFYVSY